MGHFNHIIRLCVVLIAVVIGFFIVRGFFVPESFGTYGSYQYGYHRGNSDAEQENMYALYQGTEKCAKCHEKLSKDSREGGMLRLPVKHAMGSGKRTTRIPKIKCPETPRWNRA